MHSAVLAPSWTVLNFVTLIESRKFFLLYLWHSLTHVEVHKRVSLSLLKVCCLTTNPNFQKATSQRGPSFNLTGNVDTYVHQSTGTSNNFTVNICLLLNRYLTRWSIDTVKPIYKTGLKHCKKRMAVGHPALRNNVRYGVKPLYLKHWRAESLTVLHRKQTEPGWVGFFGPRMQLQVD